MKSTSAIPLLLGACLGGYLLGSILSVREILALLIALEIAAFVVAARRLKERRRRSEHDHDGPPPGQAC